MASVTIDRIAYVQARVTEAVAQTSVRSTLATFEQDRLLEESCALACDLLEDWLASTWWGGLRPLDDGPLAECLADRGDFEKFLDPMFKDALARASRCGVAVEPDLVDKARSAVADLASRYRKMSRQQLFQVASDRVDDLKAAACELATAFRTGAQDAANRRRARAALSKVGNLLQHLAIVVAAPTQVARLGAWAHSIMVNGIAQSAQPGLSITPPAIGPTVR